ncbi:MAG TPA: hypothetical protein EYO59_05665 [Chromatiaceae bacterium]|nr:hypothetical protein [Chromatiaceae bacterium]
MARISIKRKLVVLSLFSLLVLALLGVKYWQEMRDFAISGQIHTQQLAAKTIAATLASQRNLRTLLSQTENADLDPHTIDVGNLNEPIQIDGFLSDWPASDGNTVTFGNEHMLWPPVVDTSLETKFSVRFVQSSSHLYLAVAVTGAQVVFRRPTHLRLDRNDHIRLSMVDQDNIRRRVIILAEGEGNIASFYTDAGWAKGIDLTPTDKQVSVPSHRTGVQGFWRESADGYVIEMRIPTTHLSTTQPRMHISVVDIDEPDLTQPTAIISTVPKALGDVLNPIVLHAAQLQRVIQDLRGTYAGLWIIDARGRARAFTLRSDPDRIRHRSLLNTDCQTKALAGIAAINTHRDDRGQLEQLVACHPIIQDGDVLGAVIVDETGDQILVDEQALLIRAAVVVGLAVFVLVLLQLGFATHLASRISTLRREASDSIDQHGRITQTQLQSSTPANKSDELDALSNSISALLSKQSTYTTFLERMPRTLRHEISNPLNTLKTSLENLVDQQPSLETNVYVRKLEAGIQQINVITQQLTEAASLEAAIQEDALQPMNLIPYLTEYLSNWSAVTVASMPDESIYIMGNPVRLAQMFDKLLDNATSFCPAEGVIRARIERHATSTTVTIENDGPLLATTDPSELFSPMASSRSTGSSVHLGLGLHIAALIAERHDASIKAKNREDQTGVEFLVTLPITNT